MREIYSSFLILTLSAMIAFADDGAKNNPGPVSYDKVIRPMLLRHCQGCHQPGKKQGGLDVTSYQALKKGGDKGDSFTPGKPEESVLIDFVDGDKPLMPKGGIGLPFSKEQLAQLKRWIKEGASDDSPPHRVVRQIAPDQPPVYQHPPVIPALAYSPDGEFLAIAGYHEILIHQADGAGLVHRLIGVSSRIQSLSFSPDGHYLAASGGAPGLFGELQIWDMTTKPKPRLKHSLTVGTDTTYGVSFSSDGKHVAVGCSDNSARVMRVEDGKQTLRIDHHQDWVLGSVFSVAQSVNARTEGLEAGAEMRRRATLAVESGKVHLLTIGRDRAVKLTEVESGAFIDDINKLLESLRCMTRHPTKEQIACGGDDGIPRLYQIYRTKSRTAADEDFNLIRAFEKQPGSVTALSITPAGDMLIVGSAPSNPIRIYRMSDGARLGEFHDHQGGIFALAVHPKLPQFAAAGHDGTIRLYDLSKKTLLKSFLPVTLQTAKAK